MLQKILAVLAVLGATSSVVFAYEVQTHEVLSERAVDLSDLAVNPDLLTSLGFPGDVNNPLFGTEWGAMSAKSLIIKGSRLEDDLQAARALAHFFDPYRKSGLWIRPIGAPFVQIGQASPDWAIEDKGQVAQSGLGVLDSVSEQNWSFTSAQGYFSAAIYSSDMQARKEGWKNTFLSLGHVIHHLQDMAQPQHVRNEQHVHFDASDNSFLAGTVASLPGHDDWAYYELYTRDKFTSGGRLAALLQSSQHFPVPKFKRTRDFWYSTEGAFLPVSGLKYSGMAEFTAFNYVSQGTQYRGSATGGVVASPDFPLPNGTNPSGTVKEKLPISEFVTLRNGLQVAAKQTYVVGQVFDGYSNSTYGNQKLAAVSYLSARSTAVGQGNGVFIQNNQVIEDGYKLLMPRAASFSAGLINHFFRVRLGFSKQSNSSVWVVSNKSADILDGNFVVLGEDLAGKRTVIDKIWQAALPPNQKMEIDIPYVPLGTQKVILVFQGKFGGAAGEAVLGFAEAPYTPVTCAAGLFKRGAGNAVFELEAGDISGNVTVQLESYGSPNSLQVMAGPDNTIIASTDGYLMGERVLLIAFNPAVLKSRRLKISISSVNPLKDEWQVALSCPGSGFDFSSAPAAKQKKSVRLILQARPTQTPMDPATCNPFSSAGGGCPQLVFSGSCMADVLIDGKTIGKVNYGSSAPDMSISLVLTDTGVLDGHLLSFSNVSCWAPKFIGQVIFESGGYVLWRDVLPHNNINRDVIFSLNSQYRIKTVSFGMQPSQSVCMTGGPEYGVMLDNIYKPKYFGPFTVITNTPYEYRFGTVAAGSAAHNCSYSPYYVVDNVRSGLGWSGTLNFK